MAGKRGRFGGCSSGLPASARGRTPAGWEASRGAAHLHGGPRPGGDQQGDAASIAGAPTPPPSPFSHLHGMVPVRNQVTGLVLPASWKFSRTCFTHAGPMLPSACAEGEGNHCQGTAPARRPRPHASLQAVATWRGSGGAGFHPRRLPTHVIASSTLPHAHGLLTTPAACCCCLYRCCC